MVKTTVAILFLASLAGGVPSVREVGHVTRVIPDVRLTRGRTKSWLLDRQPVAENDRIETQAGGRARMVLNDGSILNVGASSQFTVKAASTESTTGSVELAYGKIRAEVTKRLSGSAAFEVRTSTAVCGVLGTTLFVDHDPRKKFSHVINISPLDSGSLVKVRSSDSRIAGEVTLNPGQGTLVYKGKAPSVPHVMGEPDRATARAQTDVLEP
jgi:ferric-dicitrate binding protein FerR (iron transport regulator)